MIREKYHQANFPPRFIESVIHNFEKKNEEEEFVIPPWLFEEKLPFILIELPFCIENEKTAKRFLSKFHSFTENSFSIAIKWNTKKVKQLFPLKDRNPHPECKIYQGTCSCGEIYIGETNRNVEVRWSEHQHPNHKSEPARHLRENISHTFTWTILAHAPPKEKLRKYLEAFYIGLFKPTLNTQVKSSELVLFKNGVT